ncbi:DUF5712 family protein [Mucilaginibacter sp. CAU 1740]|uniref:DUF5712 family protein n=1 Tax=Mucilaginibacter sp. CAU 1740 TaxID=3140365 RepID=UPI00325B3EED
MYINITDSEAGNNKESSKQLVHYLEKENRLIDRHEPERWFNGTSNGILPHEVGSRLDDNIAKLGRDDAKFFLINISPSQKEIAWLKSQYGEAGGKDMLKAFAVGIMDEYAKNFNRPGIKSNSDLLWFGKLENHRYFNHKDDEVKNGFRKRGDIKPGEQMHIQVIVSRKDITNKIKLSPMNKSRGSNEEHSKKVGQFNRSAFKESGERLFDEQFKFQRDLKDTYRYANAQKKGTLGQRIAIGAERYDQYHGQQPGKRIFGLEKSQQTTSLLDKGHYPNSSNLLENIPDRLQTLLEPGNKGDIAPLLPKKKDKKRKGLNL